MPQVSSRTSGLGTENAFVVLKEVNDLIAQGREIIPLRQGWSSHLWLHQRRPDLDCWGRAGSKPILRRNYHDPFQCESQHVVL